MDTPVTFAFRYDRWCGWLLGLFGSGRRVSRVTVTDDELIVQLGIAFQGRVDRAAVRQATESHGRVWGWGAHGWDGRWLVNGSSKGIVVFTIDPMGSARVVGFPVKLRELRVSMEDPQGLCDALGLPLLPEPVSSS